MITVPYARCIDYSNSEFFKEHVSSIVKVYRTAGVGNGDVGTGLQDPMYMQQ